MRLMSVRSVRAHRSRRGRGSNSAFGDREVILDR